MIIEAAGLLFDNDGVLIDSDESVLAAWTTWAREHALAPEVVLPAVHGRRAADTVAAVLPELDDDAHAESVRRIAELELDAASSTPALPGVEDLLDSLSRARWAVVTSATRALAVARLEAAGLGLPDALVTADDVAQGKPAPDGYLAGARALGTSAARCVVFEDSVAGVEAGLAAGTRLVGVGLRDAAVQVDARVRDLAQVTARTDSAGDLLLEVAS